MKGLKEKLSGFFKKYYPILAITLVVAVFFWQFFLKGLIPIPADFTVGAYYPWLDYKWGYEVGVPVKNPITSDVVSLIFPMQTLGVDMLKKGEVPLWNPYILAGTPLLANLQSAPFSPTNLLYFVFDNISAWSFQIILQHFLAALFTYLLLRHWKVSKVASFFGGIIFAFSGFNIIWSQWDRHALIASFIPLIILLTDRWFLNAKAWEGILISVSFALFLFSGYPQLALYLFLALFLLWIVRLGEIRNLTLKTLLLGLFLVLGVGLAAPQILPGAELLPLSQREFEPYPFDWAFLPWVKVITFFAPDFFGNHATENYWGPQDYTSNTGYVGIVAISLALAAFSLIRKNKEVRFAILLLVFSLIFSFPTPIPIFLWKSGFLGLNAASAHRALVLFNLAVAFLAGFGVDIFLRKKISFLKTVLIPSIILVGFLGYGLYLFYLTKTDPTLSLFTHSQIPKYLVALRNLIFPFGILIATTVIFLVQSRAGNTLKRVILVALLVLGIFELFRFGWKYTPFSPRHIIFPTTPVLDFLLTQEKPVRVTGSKVIPINMKMPYKLESLEGYESVYPLRVAKFLAALSGKRSGTQPLGRYGTVDNDTSELLDLVNTKYYLTLKFDKKGQPSANGEIPDYFDSQRFKVVFEDKTTAVLESKSALPRAFMVYDWETIGDEREILNKLLDGNFPFTEKVVLEEEPPIKRSNRAKIVSKVEYEVYSENRSLINVETGQDGILFVSDTWYLDWYAFIDGEAVEILRANFNFRGIPVPKGSHEVEMVYKPRSFYNGIKVSALSLLVLLAIYPLMKVLRFKR